MRIKKIEYVGLKYVPLDWIPFKAKNGLWMWKKPCCDHKSMWPGLVAPDWASHVILIGDQWFWSDTEKEKL